MIRKYALGFAVVACGLASSAMAATASGQFNVGVTLTPKCEVFSGAGATGTLTTAISNLNLAYTSFQTTATTGTTSFQVRCTNSQSYSMALDNASLTDGTTGLNYTLNLTSNSSHATVANGNASISTATGNGLTGQMYYVHGTIPAAQDGTVTTGTANNTRTLTITY
ncbi:hypothetical protein B9Z45_02680 [Limnohabitans sp. 2KL-17]|uniref:spore coat protein U domain-containing protein n=1 Tax=Limnohabitans sp. 2KL-17 TaxID=1100704 RepID=UPI000D334CCC|nr:spore coat protein U domain-containing protein [Limnohabitans sp. 2KL-17]PUE62734.1 hypothetical protein B9Z45_02680 [Limnohabitans sp. 2KL-17]